MLYLRDFVSKLTPSAIGEKLYSFTKDYKEKKYLLAVSGGADSMVLAYIFRDLNVYFEVAHINYKLRSRDSDLDEETVKSFCNNNGINLHTYEVSQKDNPPAGSVQLWARNIRYQFFFELLKKQNLHYVVTAHHLNDQLETFLINLSRGSGIRGLSGIPNNENHILRPLLDYSKEEIYDFAARKNIEFREDLSNRKNDYLRNKIRNEIYPKITEIEPHFLENFGRSLQYLKQIQLFSESAVEEKMKKLLIKKDNDWIVDKEKLHGCEEFLQFEILRKFGFNDAYENSKIFKANSGAQFHSHLFDITVNRNELIITERKSKQQEQSEIALTVSTDNEIEIPERIETQIPFSVEWNINSEKLKLPLKLRRKKAGDIFFPAGMVGKKKISKFFKDEKLSILAKQKIWLLCDSNNQIIGVLPYRQDRRFMTNSTSEKSLKLSIKKSNEI